MKSIVYLLHLNFSFLQSITYDGVNCKSILRYIRLTCLPTYIRVLHFSLFLVPYVDYHSSQVFRILLGTSTCLYNM